MGLEAVKEEIIRHAKQQEATLLAEAREESKKIISEAEKKIEGLREEINAETKKKINAIKMQELASAELENKKMLLEMKKQLIEDVFNKAQGKISALAIEQRRSYIKKLLEKSKNDIEVANVYCNEKDLKLLEDFKAKAIDIIGGLIAENKDGTVRVDYSFDTMLQSIKENELQNISKILFG